MRNGFTLVEVVVSLGVCAVTLGVAGVCLSDTASRAASSGRRAAEVRKVERLRRAASRDLEHLRCLPGDESLRVVRRTVSGVRGDAVSFVRAGSLFDRSELSGPTEDAARARRVIYGCRPEGGCLTVFRLETPPHSVRGVVTPVLRGVSGFEIVPEKAPDDGADGLRRVAPTMLRFEVTFGRERRYAFRVSPGVTHEVNLETNEE